MLQIPEHFNPYLILQSAEHLAQVPGTGMKFDEMQILTMNGPGKPKWPCGGRAFDHKTGRIDIRIPLFDHKSAKTPPILI